VLGEVAVEQVIDGWRRPERLSLTGGVTLVDRDGLQDAAAPWRALRQR
jgi:hypothetical protein